MGIVPPYVYPPPSSYSDTDPFNIGFDPKLVSRISLQPPPPSSPKANGPLLDFNRHPDSYAALSYGNLEKTGMSPKTKMRVTSARWIQQGLRMMQLLGAMGMLACVIMVRGTQDTEGWIIRVPVGLFLRLPCIIPTKALIIILAASGRPPHHVLRHLSPHACRQRTHASKLSELPSLRLLHGRRRPTLLRLHCHPC